MTERGGRITAEIEIVRRRKGKKKGGRKEMKREKNRKKRNPGEGLKGMDSLLNHSSMSTSLLIDF